MDDVWRLAHEVVHVTAFRDWAARSAASLTRTGMARFPRLPGRLVEEIDSTLMIAGGQSPRSDRPPAGERMLDCFRPFLLHLLGQGFDDDCGPLIWPQITEQQQDAFDAACRKLYQFLITKSERPAQPT